MRRCEYMRTPRTYRSDIIHKELSYLVCGILFKVHDTLGRYAREKQYCDLIEELLKEKGITYVREKKLSATGMDRNSADFIIEGKMILEVKAKPLILREEYYQLRRYLRLANLKLGILVNFRQQYLRPKRILNSESV